MGKQSLLHDATDRWSRGCTGARQRASRCRARRTAAFAPAPDRRDPIEVLEEQAATRVPGAAADPLRPDGVLAVRVLPRCRRGHGDGPRHDAGLRHQRAALRRRPPGELRHLQLARPSARVRPQRLRRDAARAVGVGRQAPRGLAWSSPGGQRLLRGGDRQGRARTRIEQYRLAMAGFAGQRNLDVWYSRMEIDAVFADLRDRMDKQRSKVVEAQHREVRLARQPAGLRAS